MSRTIENLKKKLAEIGYDFRGVPDNYNESMTCGNCKHFKRPYPFGTSGKTHGNCSEIDLGIHNVFKVAGEADVPEDYICGKYEPAEE